MKYLATAHITRDKSMGNTFDVTIIKRSATIYSNTTAQELFELFSKTLSNLESLKSVTISTTEQ